MKFQKILCAVFAVLMVLSGCANAEIPENGLAAGEGEYSYTAGDEGYGFTAGGETFFPTSSQKTAIPYEAKGQLDFVEIEDLYPSDKKAPKEEPAEAETSGTETSEINIITLSDGDGDYDYVLNNNTMKFHKETCDSAKEIAPHNKDFLDGSRETAIAAGYVACKNCNP